MTVESELARIATALERIAAGAMVDATVAATLPAPEPVKRGPGRPPKVEAPPQPETTAEPDDGFLEEEEKSEAYTKEDVRAALVAYQGRASQEKARALLKQVGGADTLGALKEEKFAAVIEASKTSK
jgi:NACalpha-BTF3-like transcription factor